MHSLHCPPTPPMRKEQDVLCMEGIGQPAEGCDVMPDVPVILVPVSSPSTPSVVRN